MATCWQTYVACNDKKKKKELWLEVPLFFLKCINENIGNQTSSEFIPHLGNEFTSAIDEQCILWEDEPHKLLEYLSSGVGLHMLLNLAFYGDQITSCSFELCNLLLSILPLFYNEDNVRDESLLDMIPAKIEASQIKHYLQTCLRIASGINTREANVSSSDEVSQAKECVTTPNTDVERLKLNRFELYNCIITTLVSLTQNDYTVKDSNVHVTMIEKCFEFLPNDVFKLNAYYVYGIYNLILPMFNTILSFNNGVSSITVNLLTTTLFDKCARLLTAKSQTKTFIGVHVYKTLMSSLVGNLYHAKGQVPCLGTEITLLLQHLIRNTKFDLIQQLLISNFESEIVKNENPNFETEIVKNENPELNFSHLILQNFEYISKYVIILCKSTRGLKHWCTEQTNKSIKSFESLKVRNRKCVKGKVRNNLLSTDDENSEMSNESSTNEISDDDEEDEAENLSDYERFSKSSDSNEKRSFTLKGDCKKGESICMISYFIKLYVNIFKNVKDERLQEQVLRSLAHIAFCRCINGDQYLNSLLCSLPECGAKITDKTLLLVSHLLSTHQEIYQTKKPSVTASASSSLSRSTPRSQGSTTRSQGSVDSSGVEHVEVFDNKKDYQFIATLRQYLIHNDNRALKLSIIKYLKLLMVKVNNTFRFDLFNRLFLPAFNLFYPSTHLIADNMKKITFSENIQVLETFFELICVSIRNNIELLYIFYDTFSIHIFKELALSEYATIAREAVLTLEHITCISKNHNNQNSKIKHSKTLEELSHEGIIDILTTLNVLVIRADENKSIEKFEYEECLCQVLNAVNNIYSDNKFLQEEFKKLSLNYKCIKLFDQLISTLKTQKVSENDWERVEYFLDWMKVLLPICLSNVNNEAHGNIFDQIKSCLLESLIKQPILCKQALLTLLEASTVVRKAKVDNITDVLKDEVTVELKSPTDRKLDEDKNHLKFIFADNHQSEAEHGYEADQESTDTDEEKIQKTRHGSNSRKLSIMHHQSKFVVPTMHHDDLCLFVLKFISTNFQQELMEEWCDILQCIMDKIHMYQSGLLSNNITFVQLDLLYILFKDFMFVFMKDFDGTEVREIVEQVVLCLSCIEISPKQFAQMLLLFKEKNVSLVFLTSLFSKMVTISLKSHGPTYYLQFPSYFDEDKIKHGRPTMLHRTQTFMIPKKEVNIRRLKSRSHSWSSKYEVDGPRIKPLGYSNQPIASDLALIKLPLESQFTWPDKEFSFSLWFLLEDTYNSLAYLLTEQNEKAKYFKCTPSSSAWFENGCEELLHLCSFGGTNAMFEVWLGARTGYIQYRWVVSNYGNIATDIEYTPFEQVTVPHQAKLNKWHQIVITLSSLSAGLPHTTEVFTFVDGCQLPSVQMKYPAHSIQTNTKLAAYLGHGFHASNDGEENQFALDRLLKTGMFNLFQGRHSFKEQSSKREEVAVVDKVKAVYLYSLGANSTNINIEFHEYFSNRASHMDSSLSWDCVIFKDLSFCMSILSEELISNDFPIKLLQEPKRFEQLIMNLKQELQSCLMLSYNPRNSTEFYQFIPQFRTSGQIQHIYYTDVSDNNIAELNDGVPITATLLGNVVSKQKQTLQDAVHHSGGMAVLLYLHALVAEKHDSQVAQANILRSMFQIQNTCPYLLHEMNDCTGYVLFNQAQKFSPSCMDENIMKALMESICDGDIFVASINSSDVKVNINSTAIIKNVCILQILLKDWYLLMNVSTTVQEIMWKVLEVLVRPDHPYKQFNAMQYQRARVVENLLIGCQEWQQERSTTLLPESICKLYLAVINNLIGDQVDLLILKSVCSFLIAIHPTLDTVTLHSPNNFYLFHKALGNAPSNLNVQLRDKSNSMSITERSRRTLSFTEGDKLYENYSPRVILSQEDLTSGSIIPSEVIIRRPSYVFRSPKNSKDMTSTLSIPEQFDLMDSSTPLVNQQLKFFDEVDASHIHEKQRVMASPKLSLQKKMRTHRRIQSDGTIRFGVNKIEIESPKLKAKPPLIAAVSTDFEVISDSEVVSSCEEGNEDWMVVDGFIGQTMESFTPKTKNEEMHSKLDVLYHLRYGLMELIRTTLKSLPDHFVTRVIGAILKVEYLLVLVNQTSDKIREIALENLFVYLQRGGGDCLGNFNRFKGCHLLANQLHQYPITPRIIELCVALLVSKPIKLDKKFLNEMDYFESESVFPMAIVPCLTLLDGCIQRPTSFGLLSQFLIKMFDQVESLLLVAFNNGLVLILHNVIIGLSNELTGNMNTSWKKETFSHFMELLDWLVEKACCTCQPELFQMYKDLQLTFQNMEYRSKGKSVSSNTMLHKVSRYLSYHLIHCALRVFQTNDFYGIYSRLKMKRDTDHFYPPPLPELSRSTSVLSRQSTARNLFRKIRGTMLLGNNVSVATPTEIQERFLDVLTEAVKLATLVNKSDHAETTVFGVPLVFLATRDIVSHEKTFDAHQVFCKDLLHWLFLNIEKSLSSIVDDSSWNALLKVTKDELINQTNRVILHIISPLRSKDVRLLYLNEILSFKQNKAILQSLLYGNAVSKTRDQYLACINSIKTMANSNLTEDDKQVIAQFKQLTNKMSVLKMNDQKLSDEIREIKHRRREEELSRIAEACKRIMQHKDELQESIANQGMDVTNVIVDEQDYQRQQLLRVKRGNQSKQIEVKKTWRKLIHRLTQERAPWHCDEAYPWSWQLDPTEGPSRMRKRLQRCHLEIEPKFFLDDAPSKRLLNRRCHLSYLFDESTEEPAASYSFKTNDTIRNMRPCERVTPATKNAGEVLIGETHMYFVVEEALEDKNVTQAFFGDRDVISLSWRYEEIREILKRRYSLQDNALEIFLTSGRTFLLAFKDTKTRDEIYEQLVSKELSNLVATSIDINTLTQSWKNGQLTNFEYLTELNKKAGRSFNDLMQYPVFPFVLSDYQSDVLNLGDPASFRNLSKPIACQDKSKEERYIENYKYLKDEYEQRKLRECEEATLPYHYSSHYSNSGTILHFLVRLPPFTSMFLKYQDNQFDIPDRTFNSMATTWNLSSFISSTDVKELIPEFFFLQEFFINAERYDMGVRQNKERVNNVVLPKWCEEDPRLFTLINMQALESIEVSSHIHHWIDLVFGYKQTGVAAIKATNVFHPATYFGVDVEAIKDDIHRRALQTMIETYGQTPLQLFINPHTKRFSKALVAPALMDIIPYTMESRMLSSKTDANNLQNGNNVMTPLSSVVGLQWGDYCGSPVHQSPVVQWIQTFPFQAKKIITSKNDLSAYLCAENTCVLSNQSLSKVTKPIGILQWGYHDQLIRIHLIHSNLKTLFHPMRADTVTCCVFVPGADILFVGGTSGVLNVWPVRFTVDVPCLDVIGAKQNLLGHDDAITSICVCQPYSIAVTISKDQTAIIWDLNRLCYIRSLAKHESAIECVSISDSTGDIATACNTDKKAYIHLWTINAKPIGQISLSGHVNCLAFSNLPDGIAVNVIAAGFQDGSIRMWDTWKLNALRCIQPNTIQQPVVALSFSLWNPLHFISSDRIGNVYLWTSKDLVLSKPPSFILVSPTM